MLARRSRPVRYACLAAPILAVVSLLMGVQAWQKATDVGSHTVTSTQILDETGRIPARARVEQWLQAGLLGHDGQVVSWDGSDPASLSDGHEPIGARIHHFTVRTGTGQWWRVDMTMRGDTPAGDPAVTPITPAVSDAAGSTSVAWTGTLGDVKPTTALTQLLQQWGDAYAGGDAKLLRTLVGDPDTSSVYAPLGLNGTPDTKVGKIQYLDRGKVDRGRSTGEYAVARLTISVKPDGRSDASNDDMSLQFDVLIHDPDAGGPQIRAWGAPGTGPDLKEYANRSTPEKVKALAAQREQEGKTGGQEDQ